MWNVSSCCLCQRTYMAQGYMKGAPNETPTHTCWFVVLCHMCYLTKATVGNIHICKNEINNS